MIQKKKLAAVVICYFPNLSEMMNLLDMLTKESGLVILIDNGGGDKYLDNLYSLSKENLMVVCPGKNIGMAAALNRAFELAEKSGYSHLISFDQDSHLTVETLNILIDDFNRLEQAGEKIAAIGPCFYDPRLTDSQYFHGRDIKEGNHPSAVNQTYIITSGCLASVQAWRDSGGLDEKLFVDLVDTEWCWRLGQQKYKVYISLRATMAHRLSDGMKVFFKCLTFNTYAPIRRFYIARNSVYLLFF